MISQFDPISNFIWILMIFVMMLLYPVLMLKQVVWRLEQSVNMIAGFTADAKRTIFRKIPNKKSEKELKEKINNFLEFFMIEPVNLDPYGIVKKLEHIIDLSEEKFKKFVQSIVPNANEDFKANLGMSLSSAVSLYQIEKIVRHNVEMVKKTKNVQLGIIVQMQLPLIEKFSRALLYCTEAFVNGWPIGDSFGAAVAAKLIGNAKVKEVEADTVMVRKKIKGKDVFIIKAKGPGGRLGKLGKTVEKLVKRHRIGKIITIDASGKLEGEKTGTIAEGIGVAIGGAGVDRSYIENIATSKGIPLDSYVVKMSHEEAITPMPMEVYKAIDAVVERVLENIAMSKGPIIVVGVGNTCGVGNDAEAVESVAPIVKKNAEMMKRREEEEKKKESSGWFRPFGF